MAQVLQIDTLAFARKLKEAGADEKLAEAIVEGISAADTSELATGAELAAVKAGIASELAAVKAGIAEVRSDILKWMFGAIAAQTGIIIALIKLIG